MLIKKVINPKQGNSLLLSLEQAWKLKKLQRLLLMMQLTHPYIILVYRHLVHLEKHKEIAHLHTQQALSLDGINNRKVADLLI